MVTFVAIQPICTRKNGIWPNKDTLQWMHTWTYPYKLCFLHYERGLVRQVCDRQSQDILMDHKFRGETMTPNERIEWLSALDRYFRLYPMDDEGKIPYDGMHH